MRGQQVTPGNWAKRSYCNPKISSVLQCGVLLSVVALALVSLNGCAGLVGRTTANTPPLAPTITAQPVSHTVTAGQVATFSVVASGTAPLNYQWRMNGSPISGTANSAAYTTPATTTSQSGEQFTVVVSNSAGSVTSNAATLTVNAATPTVSFLPTSLTFASQTVGTTSSAQFVTFSNTGSGTLTFGTEPITGDFSFAGQGTCSTSLAAGASCTMSIKFTPTATGTRTGTLAVNDNTPTSPQVVALIGTGTTPGPLAIATASVPAGTVGQAYSTQLNATGGTTPYTWSVGSGSLAAGLSLSGAGVISGTPTTAGSSTFTATVNDATSQTASSSFTLTVASLTATSCTLYVSPSGSDSNPGTLAAPWQTPQKAANSAAAGQTVCFRGGSYAQTVTSGYQQTFNNSGSAGNPIVFTNYPGEIAVIQGSTRINGSYLTFRGTPQSLGSCDAINPCGLIFEGSQGYNIDAIDICCAVNSNPNFVTFDHVEIRKATYHAGLYQEGCNNAITGSYIHDNGAFNANRSEDNGIYWSVTPPGCINGGLIANNLVENNYSKGIQLYDGGSSTSPTNVTVTENTSVNNGAQGAVVWGDHNVFVNNVLYNNNNLSGGAGAGAQAGLYAGLANLVDQNLTFDPSGNSGWDSPTGCCITNNKQADPLFVSPSALDWHILASSPAIGFSNLNYIQPVDKDGVSRSTLPAAGAYQH
jgi:hypothetical protein